MQIFFFTCFVVYIVYPWNKRRRIIQKEISDVFEFFSSTCVSVQLLCVRRGWVGRKQMVVLYLSCAGGRDVMGVYEIILLRVQVGT